MAKIKHNNFLDTVNEVFTDAKQVGVLHLYADYKEFPRRTIIIKGRKLFHFGTTFYLGLDFDYVKSNHTYRQLLYQTIKRAIDLRFSRIDLGMTASFEKRKLGAIVNEKFAYVQASDNYSIELLGILEDQR